MNSRDGELLDRPKVVKSVEDADGFRCVDILERGDGAFVFKEFRRDPEDAGRWTLVGDYSQQAYSTMDQALGAAAASLIWFEETIKGN